MSGCSACGKAKTTHQCQICEAVTCKGCTQFLDEGEFAFLKARPADLKHDHYCPPCYDEKVVPALDAYQATIERAKGVFIFFKTQKKSIPVLRKGLKRVEIKSCADRDETIMRMAFAAAEDELNAVIEVEVTSAKVRNEGYQTSSWSGSGMPALIDATKKWIVDDEWEWG